MRLHRLMVVAALLAVACKSSTSSYGSSGGGGGPGPTQVFMQSSAFNPTSRTVSVGTTVTWVNQDGYTHTVTSSSGPSSFNSGNVSGGASFQQTFSTAGTYQYYCTIHGTPTSGMHATLIVQ
jgi:plastocyanin